MREQCNVDLMRARASTIQVNYFSISFHHTHTLLLFYAHPPFIHTHLVQVYVYIPYIYRLLTFGAMVGVRSARILFLGQFGYYTRPSM